MGRCKWSADAQENTGADLFWHKFLNGFAFGAFGDSPISELRNLVRVIEDARADSPVSPHQVKVGAEYPYSTWKSYLFYFRPGDILEILRRHEHRSGKNLGISRRDLRRQMKKRPYWCRSSNSYGYRQRFKGRVLLCWCIDVDLHPLGYIRMGDVEFDESFKSMQSGADWVDPRKGPLFNIIDALLANNNEGKD